MKSKEDLVYWATELSNEIQKSLVLSRGQTGTFYVVVPSKTGSHVRGLVASAISFLREYAGADSEWYERAKGAVEGRNYFTGAHEVGSILGVWVNNVQDDVVPIRISEGTSARTVASTDVMEQVRELVHDRAVHPAAPIVLAGAALETALRGAVEEAGLSVVGKPGISAYGQALRKAERITKQDMKDVEQMGGLRNDAAHGLFEALSPERAGLMEQQVNMFLARLAGLMGDV